MPFIRKGLCASDKIRCADYLADEVNPKEIAKLLHTTVDVVKRFTHEALNEVKARNKKRAVASEKHIKQTKKTAAVLANAAKDILTESPGDFDLD